MLKKDDSPYGVLAKDILLQHGPLIEKVTADFLFPMQELFDADEDIKKTLSFFPRNEKKSILERQISYLGSIFKPDLTQSEHQAMAHRIGRLHIQIGVKDTWTINSYNAYHKHIHAALVDFIGDLSQFSALTRILDRRLWIDLEEQTNGMNSVKFEHLNVFDRIIEISEKAKSLTDLYEDVIAELCKIDGILAVFIARLDSKNVFEIEASSGSCADAYLNAMHSGKIPRIQVIPGDENPGPASRAWVSGVFTTVPNYQTEKSLHPWQKFGMTLGFRSSAAMPLVDENGKTFALLSIYCAYTGFFDPEIRKILFLYIQKMVSVAAARHKQYQIIPIHTKTHYLKLLANDRIAVEYQPIIDLKTGKLRKLEALARLKDDNGRLILPGKFLGALGSNELLHLFESVLGTVCTDLKQDISANSNMSVSINFPPQGLTDLRYQKSLFRKIKESNISGSHIELEILETNELSESPGYTPFLEALHAYGISLVQDDLGSGYSSLLRMGIMQFEGVKIEQGLVRGAMLRKPWRLLKFIKHLSDLAHALHLPVTVEGLENEGLIEATAILGVDYGQGYGIAYPMQVSAIQNWEAQFNWTIDRYQPKTELGLLAAFQLWDANLKAFPKDEPLGHEFIERTSPFYKYLKRRPVSEIDNHDLDVAIEALHQFAAEDVDSDDYIKFQDKIIDLLSTRWNDHMIKLNSP